MRILQVSAHYPPDFVSGGALIPQRFATELQARGHECSVFAGNLHRLAPGEVADEWQGDIRVRWVGNSNALAWFDVYNVDNPAMYGPFEEFVAEVKPDVVHFHSIQTIGAGALKIAQRHARAVVVTMHDFWWSCARQFLVDQADKPCSPVVSAANCQCAAGRKHLDQRNRWLADQLTYADLILFPSASARDLMIANGVPAHKSAVNENGVDFVGLERARTAVDRPVRFIYTGGEATMKGFEVLREACASAEVAPGTSLDVYNTPDDGFPAWVRSQPAYGREDLPQIFGHHDVLILPSLMRESHSIVTREALKAGMAVIATDSVGPEEVIIDGHNGRIVAAGSVTDLRAAIEELSEPSRAFQLLGHGSASPIVSVRDQIDDVEAHYRALLRDIDHHAPAVTVPEPATPEPAALQGPGDQSEAIVRAGVARAIRTVVFVVGIQGAMARYRAHLPAEALRLRGMTTVVMHYRDPGLSAAVLSADAVVIYRVPATNQVLELISQVKNLPRIVPVLGDIDDLIFDPDIVDSLDNLDSLSTEERELWVRGIHRYRTTLDVCDYFVGSTQTVSREGARLLGVPAQRFANGIGHLLGSASQEQTYRERTPGPLRIGFFSGTKTHDADWASIEGAVAQVLASRPEVELWLGGLVEPTAALEPYWERIVRIPFVAWYELPAYLRDLDICLAPLTADSIFNEAKSAIKWLEAALVETPTVAFPSQPFREAIDDGQTGFLARTPEEWVTAITSLIDDDALRTRIGRRAKRAALLTLSPILQGRAYETILVNAWRHVQRNGHKNRGTFPPVLDDEPALAAAAIMERYELPKVRHRAVDVVRMTSLKTIHSLRVNGVSGTMRKVYAKIRVGQ
ncbi:glycosyltransferase [Trueperella pecoris]|uniref:glycosyltransferase n=1 Tax=Trueperella pecoris TaxID=2733571 RepID=UPI00186B592F|nr:glycosyltransferase [Trueperella pecoris]QOQ38319.1 glycosyltransferase [Trueperella pecoris]